MKKIKYVALSLLTFALVACDNDLVEDLRDIRNLNVEPLPELSIEGTGLDFSNYVAVGASYTAGYSD